MKKQSEGESEVKTVSASSSGSELARILAIVGINGLVVLLVVIFASPGGGLPDLNAQTLGIGLLPVSAAMGLMLACRRMDLAMPALLALAVAMRAAPPWFFPQDPTWQIVAICGIGAGFCLVSALVTWIGRISSAFWTALVAVGLWSWSGSPTQICGWPWPAGLAISLAVLGAGAAVLGITGLVSPPASPPIIRSGSKGVVGLSMAWILAGVAVALASQSEASAAVAGRPMDAYPPLLAALALGGSYILRGNWGALAAVVLTGTGHLVWFFAWNANLGSPVLDFALPAAAPIVAIPLYLIVDWIIRHSTSESPPTGLLA